ncbi:MAG: hypothetical protein ACI97B_003993, partial [Verrucomicrobiales bacterium]
MRVPALSSDKMQAMRVRSTHTATRQGLVECVRLATFRLFERSTSKGPGSSWGRWPVRLRGYFSDAIFPRKVFVEGEGDRSSRCPFRT